MIAHFLPESGGESNRKQLPQLDLLPPRSQLVLLKRASVPRRLLCVHVPHNLFECVTRRLIRLRFSVEVLKSSRANDQQFVLFYQWPFKCFFLGG